MIRGTFSLPAISSRLLPAGDVVFLLCLYRRAIR